MSVPFRIVFATVALGVCAGVGVAEGQTVVVRKVPPGTAVELVVNTTPAGQAVADAAGDASITFNLQEAAGAQEVDATIALDVCGAARRVVLAARGMASPAPEQGCDRRPVSGLFLLRRITTLVVNADSVIPSVLLIQGDYDLSPEAPVRTVRSVPTGLVLFGGAGRGTYGEAGDLACGNVASCAGEGQWGAVTAGVDFWVVPYFALTGSFVKPAQFDVTGDGEVFEFNSFVDAYVLTLGGKLGIPMGPFRAYGHAGGTYHRANLGTTQTNDETTITVGGVQQTIPGGTQAFEVQTAGWGLAFGGGIEAWLNRTFALYGDVSRVGIKGDAREGEGSIDDNLLSIGFGARIRFGR
jgi:hypothetical protein